jgi:hypothetical protein
MPADRTHWFTAEAGAPGHDEPCVSLRRRGDPPTGNPGVDAWRDRGARYVLSLDEAMHLRDTLDEALADAGLTAYLDEAAKRCRGCPEHEDVPCGGCQQGGFCDYGSPHHRCRGCDSDFSVTDCDHGEGQ